MRIRDAVPEDAVAACEVMRRSIAELYVADHHNDPAILERWLDKTPEIFKSWICFLDFLFGKAFGPRPGFDRHLAVLG
jgi:hypothetical protein